MRRIEHSAGRYALLVLTACAALLTSTGPTAAQDGTGAIATTRAAVVFPAAIQFAATIDAPPATITRSELSVSQAGETLFTFESSDAAYERQDAGTRAELIVTWTPDEPPYPRPFAPLSYTWTVETVEGEVSTVSGEVEYADRRFRWRAAGEPPLTLHWHNNRLAGERIRAELEAVAGALRERTGGTPEFEIAIYDPDAQLCPPVDDPATGARAPGVVSPLNEQVFPCDAAQYARAYERAGVLFVQRPSLGYSELRDLLAARMARKAYELLWDEAGVTVPAWFAEGLAALYRPGADLAALGLVRAALEDASALPAEALASDPPAGAPLNERALWQAQSAILVRYLADRNGPDAPFEVAQALAEGEPFEDALAALDDTLPDGLWDTWAQWAFFDEAERAAAWTPYQAVVIAPTAAPTRAPTATNTPTRAPSRTPTAEPTVTPTPIGRFAPQVIVGQAPTEQPVTPTNTALPPGSLPTAAPRPRSPVDSVTPALDTTATLGVALLASGGVLFLVALGLLIRQRS